MSPCFLTEVNAESEIMGINEVLERTDGVSGGKMKKTTPSSAERKLSQRRAGSRSRAAGVSEVAREETDRIEGSSEGRHGMEAEESVFHIAVNHPLSPPAAAGIVNHLQQLVSQLRSVPEAPGDGGRSRRSRAANQNLQEGQEKTGGVGESR